MPLGIIGFADNCADFDDELTEFLFGSSFEEQRIKRRAAQAGYSALEKTLESK